MPNQIMMWAGKFVKTAFNAGGNAALNDAYFSNLQEAMDATNPTIASGLTPLRNVGPFTLPAAATVAEFEGLCSRARRTPFAPPSAVPRPTPAARWRRSKPTATSPRAGRGRRPP